MPDSPKHISVVFFRNNSEVEPVREWLLTLSQDDRRIIGRAILRVEVGWPIGMPTCRLLEKGLWEVRANLPHGRAARVIFCVEGDDMYLLHGFIKKTQKTPRHEIDIAHQRRKELGI